LALLSGHGDDGTHVGDKVALLLDARFKPKMQYFSDCVLQVGVDAKTTFKFPEQLPVRVVLQVVQSPLTKESLSLHTQSSDDLAYELARFECLWSIRSLE